MLLCKSIKEEMRHVYKNFFKYFTVLHRHRESLFKREKAAREALSYAMDERDQKKIEEALGNCFQHGVDEITILEAEKFLVIVNEEDELIREIKLAHNSQDIERLEDFIKKFR